MTGAIVGAGRRAQGWVKRTFTVAAQKITENRAKRLSGRSPFECKWPRHGGGGGGGSV